MAADSPLRALGEFGLIARVEEGLARGNSKTFLSVLKGIGDDAAVCKLREEGSLLVTTDLLIEGVHFDLAYEPPETLGFKALAVNASDIGAMGGEPWGFVLALALPSGFSKGWLDRFLSGMAAFQDAHPCLALGGDTSKSPGGAFLCVTFLGRLPASSRLLARDGARPGDRILVTGIPGSSALGLNLLKRLGPSALENQEARPFVEAYLKPRPPLVFAKEVAQKGLANAAIDISDGLVQDLGHIARLSNLRAFIELESIPLEWLEPMSCMLGIEASDLALAGGEDYGLILSVPAHSIKGVQRLGKRLNVKVHEVGRFEGGEQGVYICKKGQAPLRLRKGGYEHFRDESAHP